MHLPPCEDLSKHKKENQALNHKKGKPTGSGHSEASEGLSGWCEIGGGKKIKTNTKTAEGRGFVKEWAKLED